LGGGMAPMDHADMDSMGGMTMTPGTTEGEPAAGSMDHAAMGHGDGPPHLNDVEYDAYLANDRSLADPEVVPVEAGGRVRLRIINGSASTNFMIDLGALDGTLVAVDGHSVVQVAGRRFPLAIAQRADIRLKLPAGAWPILARREGDTAQTGVILATPGAAIAKLPERGADAIGAIGLDLEARLVAATPLAAKPAGRRLLLELNGSMMPFVWTLNGAQFGAHTPLAIAAGERVHVEMLNATDMAHPMHLHGHVFQVVAIDGAPLRGALRDTVLVPVGGRITIAFDADNPGHWALHCHNLYHMAAGMMTSLRYES
ncbi:MAG: multicopper oxidase family protein, partial [Dongiaceae bacterium]